jgi:hypothetical protein
MRISLKEILAIIAGAAVFFWCAAEARFDNGLFWGIACAAAVVSTLFVLIAKQPHGRWLTLFLAPGAFFFFILLLMSNALLWFLALIFIASLIVSVLPRQSTRVLVCLVTSCSLAALVGAVVVGRTRLHELEAMREAFPIESLANRLAYETVSAAGASEITPALSQGVALELVEFENTSHGSRSDWALRRIHQREYELFIRASGFGIERVRPQPTIERLQTPPLENIDLIRHSDDGPARRGWRYRDWSVGREEKESDDPGNLHRALRNDFLNAEGFGAVLTRLIEVIGFVNHAAHFPPTAFMDKSPEWNVERMELVSLLKFPEPRVYVLDHLPRMDQLSSNNAPTRPLDNFEKPALARLRTDEDVIIKERDGQTRMLGSLRAANQCLDCHSVHRGELLGAFTYILHRESPSAAPKGPGHVAAGASSPTAGEQGIARPEGP